MEEQAATPEAQKRTKMIAILVIVFGIFHCFTLLVAMLPRDVGINKLLAPYRHLTGTQQEWGMFYTIPTMQSNEITVEVRDVAGAVTTRGPILPGLRPYEVHSKIRHYYLLNQLTDPQGKYLDAYLDSLRSAVAAKAEGEPQEFSLRIESDFIRLLKRITEDGNMTVRKSETLGPFAVEKE